MCAHVCSWKTESNLRLLYKLPTFFYEDFCLAWCLMTKLGWVACKHILCLQSSELKVHATTSGVLHGFWCGDAGRINTTKLAISPASITQPEALAANWGLLQRLGFLMKFDLILYQSHPQALPTGRCPLGGCTYMNMYYIYKVTLRF